jgi:hypothetical protein
MDSDVSSSHVARLDHACRMPPPPPLERSIKHGRSPSDWKAEDTHGSPATRFHPETAPA